MDPLGSITALASVVSYLLDVAAKVQQNRAECLALGTHAQSLLVLLQAKRRETLPEDVNVQLSPLIRYVCSSIGAFWASLAINGSRLWQCPPEDSIHCRGLIPET